MSGRAGRHALPVCRANALPKTKGCIVVSTTGYSKCTRRDVERVGSGAGALARAIRAAYITSFNGRLAKHHIPSAHTEGHYVPFPCFASATRFSLIPEFSRVNSEVAKRVLALTRGHRFLCP
ncbi:hypothetical protein EVAR_45838_1 [Eumeta japonica]|uniref:Uncharacterized protein n=1 Tax=Eumeta variegata TaxID=151549 RepID=A0A4C1WNV0_EUMVA|nr:hypothetical protein EVAR_45838_1 [Eumeta japonica]